MKDSQLTLSHRIARRKYIKENNERFSTITEKGDVWN